MSFLAGLAPILGTAFSVAGSLVSGFSAMSAANYQAKVAAMNAQIAEDNAKRAVTRSAVEAQDQDALTRAMLGEQEAIQSASGVSLASRSSVLTRKAAAELGRRDALNVRQAGELEAYGYRTDAMNMRAQGALAKMEGRNALLGSFLGAGASLVGGANGVASPRRYGGTTWDPWTTRGGTSLRRVG